MDLNRARLRTAVDIAVTLTSVLDSIDARVIDLNEKGAQIHGAALPAGTKFQIACEDQIVYAQCRWSEIDRMGVSFPFGLHDGPLYERLIQARALKGDAGSPLAAQGYAPGVSAPGGFPLVRAAAGRSGFGRRALA